MPPQQRILMIVNDINYFSTIKEDDAGKFKLEAKGDEDLLTNWKKGDTAIVWLTGESKPAAWFHVIDIQPREDAVADLVEFDEKKKHQPHLVKFKNGQTMSMDLSRDVYKVVYQSNNRPVSSKKLSEPIGKEALKIKIQWQTYKYTVHGKDLQSLDKVSGFPKYKLDARGYTLLEGEDCAPYFKALKGSADKGTPSAKRKLEYVNSDADDEDEGEEGGEESEEEEEEEERTPAKRAKVDTKKSPTPKKATPKRSTPTPKSPTKSPKTPTPTKRTPSSRSKPKPSSSPEELPTLTSSRVSTPPDKYKPSPSTKSASKSPRAVSFESGTKEAKSATPGRRSSDRPKTPTSKSSSEASSSSSSSANSGSLDAGVVIAVRADSGKDFVIARVRKAFNIPQGRDNDRAIVKVTWLVEARESGLHGCFAAPNWPATVQWGAVIKTHLNMRYDKEKDMYWLADKHSEVAALV